MIDYPPRSLTAKVFDGIASLKSSHSKLWKSCLLKFLNVYSYFSVSIIFVLLCDMILGTRMSHQFLVRLLPGNISSVALDSLCFSTPGHWSKCLESTSV
jgi:hypothetical protein